jgi:uncharacterized membrane protein YphA (DoxX/SURF4 family)
MTGLGGSYARPRESEVYQVALLSPPKVAMATATSLSDNGVPGSRTVGDPRMSNRTFTTNLGIQAYAAGAIALGLIGIVWADFASSWQLVGPAVPGRTALAYLAALCELAGGFGLLWPRSARAGAALLTIVYSVFTLLWLAKALADPKIYDSWGNVFEELSLVIAGLVLSATLAPRRSAQARRKSLISRAYGICVISFGVVHVVIFAALPAYIPKWIPPGQLFWAYTTSICFFLAAAAILSGVLATLASRLLTVMIAGFWLLIWVPRLFTLPHDHFSWSANGIAFVMAGACWAVSDSIAESAKLTAAAREARLAVGISV